MGRFKGSDGKGGFFKFIFGFDGKDGSARSDRYTGDRDGHEHAWSKRSTDGKSSKEGWHGKRSNFED